MQPRHFSHLHRAAAIFLALLLAVSFGAAAQNGDSTFTLEQILGSPFPSSLVAAPSGGHVAWVFNHRGVRNVWVASPPEYRGRQLTDYHEDDGQELTSLAFSSDGEHIVFVRGGAPNSRGELPNPLSLIAPVERAIWEISLSNDTPRRIGEGSSPLYLPDGSLLLLRKGEVWKAAASHPGAKRARRKGNASPAEAQEPKRLIAGRGSFGNLRLSPDGTRLAFTNGRGTHSYIGVFDLETEQLRFLDPSVDQDRSPAWSPDGSTLAFLRLPARTADREIFSPQREAYPWWIRVVDVESGEGRALWQADPGMGSVFRGVVGPDQLFWTADDYIVFPWEREGWTHLYSISVGDRPSMYRPRGLTPGSFEIEYAVLGPERRTIYYSSNQDDIDRRHLWQVAGSSGPPNAITSGGGIEQSPVPIPGSRTIPGGPAIAFLHATGRRPLQPAIRLENGETRDLAPDALAGFPSDRLTEPQQVIFRAADGMEIHGQLFEPPDTFTGKRPALLFFHGGSRRHMMLGWHYSSYYHNCYAFNQYMASQGWVVMSVNYRSGIGYGVHFREALNYGATGASEFRDVMGAGLYLQSRDDVDPERIALWGGSYGGYLTALGLSRASDLFGAGVDLHGVHDWNQTIKNFVPSYNELENPERTRLAFESSPMASIDTWRSPVLLIHGDDDRNVPFRESVSLVEKLRQQGVEHEVLVFPDEVHGFLTYRNWLQAFERSAAFLKRHLDD